MTRKALFALVLGFSLIPAAHAQEVSPETADAEIEQEISFSACETNADCTIAEGICGNWIAVNKSAEPVYLHFVRLMRDKGKCPGQSTAPRPAEALCTNKICQIPGQPQD